jgi:hypothetical protein
MLGFLTDHMIAGSFDSVGSEAKEPADVLEKCITFFGICQGYQVSEVSADFQVSVSSFGYLDC